MAEPFLMSNLVRPQMFLIGITRRMSTEYDNRGHTFLLEDVEAQVCDDQAAFILRKESLLPDMAREHHDDFLLSCKVRSVILR